MNAYRISRGATLAGLERIAAPRRALAAGEVRVAMRAVALNQRDLQVAAGRMGATAEPIVPASDGVGVVVETGAGVQRWRVGDRVIAAFFPEWLDGLPEPGTTARGLGGGRDGVLAEEVVLREAAWFRGPAHLGDAEAATLATAGVVAWNALFEAGGAKAGDTVVLLGSGGVSVFALQLAHAAGLRTIVTTSSSAKRERLCALGADVVIDTQAEPEWQDVVLNATAGRGADFALDVGGEGTLARSLAAVRMGGAVAVVGGLGDGFPSTFDGAALMGGAKRLLGVLVGSRAMAERLVRFLEDRALRPVVDRVFPFAQARAAYEYLASGRHLGKVVVEVASADPVRRVA
jgi:NADPH:quinone reductase-like Zn-dependent oxidoreductase